MLNLGAGPNPMGDQDRHPGFTINADIATDLMNENLHKPRGDYVLFSAGHLPFRPNVFDEVHAINPFGFYPVAQETTRLLAPGGRLLVSGNMTHNKYAKNTGQDGPTGKHAVAPDTVGLSEVGRGSGVPFPHDFGKAALTKGRKPMATDLHGWAEYQKPRSKPLAPVGGSSSKPPPRPSSGDFGGPKSAFAQNLQKAFQKGGGLF